MTCLTECTAVSGWLLCAIFSFTRYSVDRRHSQVEHILYLLCRLVIPLSTGTNFIKIDQELQ